MDSLSGTSYLSTQGGEYLSFHREILLPGNGILFLSSSKMSLIKYPYDTNPLNYNFKTKTNQ